jgi:alpha-glucosidase
VLSNHDVRRHVTRLAPVDADGKLDLVQGLARARAASMVMLALPGSAYLYQGEELGLPEVMDLPAEARQDPTFLRTAGEVIGRDGCRVPIPWEGTAPSYGFGPGEKSWLPQPDYFADLSVAAQTGVADSTLEMYRSALRIRRDQPGLGDGELEWLDSPQDVVAFARGSITVVANMGDRPITWPATELLLGSGSGVHLDGGQSTLPPETAAWLR